MSSAYLLVSHGSRDPRPDIAMQQLARLLSERLPHHEHLVGTATLELNSQPLHQQIEHFAQKAQTYGCDRLKIVPLFLIPGVHVMTDIPGEVTIAQQTLGQEMIIDVRPHLGTHPGMVDLLTQSVGNLHTDALILLAHGSRRPGSQTPVETIAHSLGAVTAYWSVSPSLESRVKEIIATGKGEIAILPYFLFAGGITDAIAQAVEELKLQFPEVTWQLMPPLGASAELANLIWELTN
jgi:sirohydrochlorin cobaltochelatase